MREIELLAPAKNRESAFAAIDHGADAIYIGGARFGARHAASNSVEDIARVVEYAHQYGVRVHCTLNTLIFESELKEAERAARELVSTGIDALIVQDMAFARMNLPIDLHASTQMCNMTPESVRFLEDCGFSRVVLERALSLDKITKIREATTIELEAFVHGAICVSHSGRCYLSRSLSERSGNRGECSQPCRLTYDLVDGAGRKLLEEKHLLSVKDLNLSSQIGNLIDAGVCSFKVEGRLKDIGYTKNIVGYYRREIDKAIAQREGVVRSSLGESSMEFTPNPSKSFTRGESEYLLFGQRPSLASFDTPKSMGERLGTVSAVRRTDFRLSGFFELSSGDGVCFVTPKGLVGTNINSVDGEWITPNRIDGITKGVELFRNFDKRFNDDMERSRTRRSIGVEATFKATPIYLCLQYRDISGLSVEVSRSGEFDEPRNVERMQQIIVDQLSKSGDTIFRVDDVALEGETRFVASSLLSEMRREALEALRLKRCEAHIVARHFSEKSDAKLPQSIISAEYNVTNSLAREFYLSHGAESVAEGLDLTASFDGVRVMQSSYCIRREIGECLKQGSKLPRELYIERGERRYRLDFDCAKCQMNIICER